MFTELGDGWSKALVVRQTRLNEFLAVVGNSNLVGKSHGMGIQDRAIVQNGILGLTVAKGTSTE